jgi:L,D-transpeptidase YcbB
LKRFVWLLCLWLAPVLAIAQTWFQQGVPTPAAQVALDWLQGAGEHGLLPEDYAATKVAEVLRRARQVPLTAPVAAQWEEVLQQAVRQYLSDLHGGRVDPRGINLNFRAGREQDFDADAVLRSALDAGHVQQAEDKALPRTPLYGWLRQALVQYRALVGHEAWRQPLPPLPRSPGAKVGKLEVGQHYMGMLLLVRRLHAFGDWPRLPDPLPDTYNEEAADAIRRFQSRHGLLADGVLGRATLAQLEVKPESRVRQIELSMERLRWTPLWQSQRMIVVNLPEFVLRAYEVRDGHISVQAEMKVVVGRALDTRTPVFDEDMRSIEFSPYWNVPRSIAVKELLPRLRRDPSYFDRQGFEFVLANGAVAMSLTAELMSALTAGRARLRQRPGPLNALGDIKFVFPNSENIYLHHTPATALFGRDRRDFSHGCIRVEDPVALASFVLKGMPGWDEARIREAMEAGVSSTLRLDEPLPVLIAYGTALVKQGRMYFFDDIYGHDRVLDAALRRRVPPVRVPAETP